MARLSLLLLSAAVAATVSANDPFIWQVVPEEETSTDHLLNAERHFSLFKTKFGKTYATAEEHDYRLTVFKSNLRRAKCHQLLDSTAEHGVTKFSDFTASEFCERYLGLKSGFSFPSDANKVPILPTGDIPEEFDYVIKICVNLYSLVGSVNKIPILIPGSPESGEVAEE